MPLYVHDRISIVAVVVFFSFAFLCAYVRSSIRAFFYLNCIPLHFPNSSARVSVAMPVFDNYAAYKEAIAFSRTHSQETHVNAVFLLTKDWAHDKSLYDGITRFLAFGPKEDDPPDISDIAATALTSETIVDSLKSYFGSFAEARCSAFDTTQPTQQCIDNVKRILDACSVVRYDIKQISELFDRIHGTRDMRISVRKKSRYHRRPSHSVDPDVTWAMKESARLCGSDSGMERAIAESMKPEYSTGGKKVRLSNLEQWRLEEAIQASIEEMQVCGHNDDDDEDSMPGLADCTEYPPDDLLVDGIDQSDLPVFERVD